jgi:hypothetical protein
VASQSDFGEEVEGAVSNDSESQRATVSQRERRLMEAQILEDFKILHKLGVHVVY